MNDHPIAGRLKAFLLPRLTRRYLVRVLLIALASVLFFRYVCRPVWIRGSSMEPTYRDGSFNFICRMRYWFDNPSVGDVVGVRLAGTRVMYLKRVVAVAGDTVAFIDGTLWVNREPMDEPYITAPCDWELEPRTVKPGFVYVVGDNRDVDMDRHLFGQTPVTRVMGIPLW